MPGPGTIVTLVPNQGSINNNGNYGPNGGAATAVGAVSDADDGTWMQGTNSGDVRLGFTTYTLNTAIGERVLQVKCRVRMSGPFGQNTNGDPTGCFSWGNHTVNQWHTEDCFPAGATGTFDGSWWPRWPVTNVELDQTMIDMIQMNFHSTMLSGSTALVFEERIDLEIVRRPSLVQSGPIGTNPGNTHTPVVAWTPTIYDNYPQKKYRIKVFDLNVSPSPAFGDSTGLAWDSGATTSGAISKAVGAPLKNGSYRAMVEVAKDFNGADWFSNPDATDFVIADPLPLPTNVGPTGTLTTTHPNLQATIFMSTYGGAQPVKARWQIATDAAFTQNLTTWEIPNWVVPAAGGQTVFAQIPDTTTLAQGLWYLRALEFDQLGDVGAWSATANFTVSHAPSTTNRTPVAGVQRPIGNTTFTWQFTSPTPTAFQTAYQILIQTTASAQVYDSGKVVSGATQATVSLAANNLQWAIRVWDDEDTAGAYSAFSPFSVQDQATIVVTNASPLTSNHPTITWTFTATGGRTQASHRVRITDDRANNALVYDSSVISGTGLSQVVGGPDVIKNNWNYTIVVDVVDSIGIPGSGSKQVTTFWLPPNPVTGLSAAIASITNDANLLGPGKIATIGYVHLNWNATNLGSSFGYYEVQRFHLGPGLVVLDPAMPIAHITTESVHVFNDFECARTVDGSIASVYTVFVYDKVKGLSQQSATVSANILVNSTCNVYLTSNYTPALSLAYQDTSPYDFTTGDTALVREHRILGRSTPVQFRSPGAIGDVFTRELIVGALAHITMSNVDMGRAVFDPLLARIRDGLAPYVCMADGFGRRWYCGLRFMKGHFEPARAVYLADVEFTEVSDIPTVVVAASPWQP